MNEFEIESDLARGTRVQITNSKDSSMIGIIGAIRHNFPQDICPDSPYILSIDVEKQFKDQVGIKIYNLVKDDKYTPVFVDHNKDGYYIEGFDFVSGRVFTESIDAIMKKFNASYDYNNKIYLFQDKDLCLECLKYIILII